MTEPTQAAGTALPRASPNQVLRQGDPLWSSTVPAKGGHLGSGLRVGGFGVPPTPVGGFTNRPQGIPVLRANATTDAESWVSRMTVSLRSARPFLQYCLIREDL